MGSININFADVEGSFDPVAAGAHPVIVDKVEIRESKSSEHNYLNWELTISDGEDEGRKLWMITSLSPKALFRLKDVFDALGVLDDEMELEWDEDVAITNSTGPLLLAPDVIGLECVAIVKHETWEGKVKDRVEEIRPAGDEPEANGSRSTPEKRGGAPAAKKTQSGRRALR